MDLTQKPNWIKKKALEVFKVRKMIKALEISLMELDFC
jgi:hypothetical protein